MEILTTAQKYLKLFGIFPIPVQDLPSIFRNVAPTIHLIHTVLFAGSLLLYLSSLVHFLIFKANNHVTFFASAFFCTLTFMRVLVYFLMVSGRSELFELIDDLKGVVNRSEHQCLCIKQLELHLPFFQEVKIWKLVECMTKKLKSRTNSPASFSNICWSSGVAIHYRTFCNHTTDFTHCITESRHLSHCCQSRN